MVDPFSIMINYSSTDKPYSTTLLFNIVTSFGTHMRVTTCYFVKLPRDDPYPVEVVIVA